MGTLVMVFHRRKKSMRIVFWTLLSIFILSYAALLVYWYSHDVPEKSILASNGLLSSEVQLVPTNSKITGRRVTFEDACNCTQTERTRKFSGFNPSSTCAMADLRGPHQKIVSFSFYGPLKEERQYFAGIKKNAERVRSVYGSSWTMRVYHNAGPMGKPLRELCDLWCFHDNLDFCDVRHIPEEGFFRKFEMVWRFLAMTDSFVDVFLSRDLDSFISQREAAAVGEWMESNKTYHVMRDHKLHGVPILGGMWGAKLTFHRPTIQKLGLAMINAADAKRHGEDQNLLARILWPAAKNDCVIHDSFHCENKQLNPPTVDLRPFPTCREDGELNFVGAPVHMKIDVQVVKCPTACRIKSHVDECRDKQANKIDHLNDKLYTKKQTLEHRWDNCPAAADTNYGGDNSLYNLTSCTHIQI
ncbi:unnamed protein product [Cyprideis torosa]|uniref:Uncharacterized protein n=1 Tax=Cyprideis torosa TaxID=163714 RepID=A0A7R8WLC5_9CRUS|nr:unnamed protein product [Cyprideis torosa]CAG0901437.1 unnamed protein product [Cyprideis torosa]